MTAGECGRSRRRVEDARFLTGQGRYVDDLAIPGQLYAHVLRSPHAHAAVLRIDTAAAAAMPGVAGVFTAADLRADGLGCLPCIARVPTVAPLIVPPRPALAEHRVRHVGDPVVLIVAETPPSRADAAEQVVVEYAILPAVVDAAAALAPDAPLLWEEAAGNLAFRFQKGERAAVDAAFAAAATTVTLALINNRVVPAAIEPRAAIASHDAARGAFRLLLSGQGVHSLRRQLAEDIFHVPLAHMHVVAPDVGGGFGVKNFLYPEYVLVLFAARRLGRDRRLDRRAQRGFRQHRARPRQPAPRRAWRSTPTGRFLALDVDTVANLGAAHVDRRPRQFDQRAGQRAWAAATTSRRSSCTCAAPTPTPCRSTPIAAPASRRPTTCIERLIDAAAARLGQRRVALRRRNLIAPFPHRTPHGDHDRRRPVSPTISRPALAARRPCRLCRAPRGSRRRGVFCAASASPAFSRPRAERRTSAPRSASRRTAASPWCSARNRTARGTRPAFRRSPPTCWGCRSTASATCRPTPR